MNEDEQILIFSTVKEKMQNVATELCKIQEYELFKALMREVRFYFALFSELHDNENKKYLEKWNWI